MSSSFAAFVWFPSAIWIACRTRLSSIFSSEVPLAGRTKAETGLVGPGVGAVICGGRYSGVIASPSSRMIDRSSALRSSRMLPGQS